MGQGLLGGNKILDVYIRGLRVKLEPDPANPIYLITVRGRGYSLGDS
ncbi:MAG: winged helix-turn-helix domain-containing protein [Armatimonadetes bacterium]|nr:winged helix-turn-helix domain-containing protein [Armatimonadota bacterium]